MSAVSSNEAPMRHGALGPCQLWTQALGSMGYGVAWHKGKWALAHRVAYAEHVGPLEAGKQIHHRCGTKSCVNPEHLVQLSPSQHAAEHPEKPGIARRNGAVSRKISMEQAREIREKYGEPSGGRRPHARTSGRPTLQQLGDEYGLSIAQVSFIVNGKSYVEDEEVMPK